MTELGVGVIKAFSGGEPGSMVEVEIVDVGKNGVVDDSEEVVGFGGAMINVVVKVVCAVGVLWVVD